MAEDRKPTTIEELEAILNSEDDHDIKINPDGTITAVPRPAAKPGEQIVVDNANCDHEWCETYYGYQCVKCPVFIVYGCEPWVDYSDDDKAAGLVTEWAQERGRQ